MGNYNKESQIKWQEPNIPLEKLPAQSSQERLWPPKRPLKANSQLSQVVVSRDHIDSDQVPLPLETSENSRSPPSSSLESSHSRDSSEKSPTISRTISDSSLLPSSPSKRLLRLTWSASSRTPTCALSTPRESPSCQRTCSWPEESEARDLE